MLEHLNARGTSKFDVQIVLCDVTIRVSVLVKTILSAHIKNQPAIQIVIHEMCLPSITRRHDDSLYQKGNQIYGLCFASLKHKRNLGLELTSFSIRGARLSVILSSLKTLVARFTLQEIRGNFCTSIMRKSIEMFFFVLCHFIALFTLFWRYFHLTFCSLEVNNDKVRQAM